MTFSVLGFCIWWYELNYDISLVISTNKDKMRFPLQWSDVVSHLATRCLWGYIWPKVSMTRSLTKCQPDLKPDLWVGGTCDPYYFYTHLKLWRLISLLIMIFFTYFLSGNAWYRFWVKWHGKADKPHRQRRNFIEMLQNYFWITFHSLSPQFFST